jgi:hypothetical protein
VVSAPLAHFEFDEKASISRSPHTMLAAFVERKIRHRQGADPANGLNMMIVYPY